MAVEKNILFAARRYMKWSQVDTAAYADVSPRTIYRSETSAWPGHTMVYFWLLQPIPQDMKNKIQAMLDAHVENSDG